jgi:hypothetical protein
MRHTIIGSIWKRLHAYIAYIGQFRENGDVEGRVTDHGFHAGVPGFDSGGRHLGRRQRGVSKMNETLVRRGGVPRCSRAGNAIPLSEACASAGVEMDVGRLAIRRMSIFALTDASGIWLVSPASIEILVELGRRQGVPGTIRGGILA